MKKTVFSLLMLLLMMTVVLSLAACGGGGGDSSRPTSGSDTGGNSTGGTTTGGTTTGGTTTGGNIAVAGTWQITDTELSDTCSGPPLSTETFPLTLEQQGSTITYQLGGVDYVGTISGNNIHLTGVLDSAGTTTTLTQDLTVSADGKSLSGNGSVNVTNASLSFSCAVTSSLTGAR